MRSRELALTAAICVLVCASIALAGAAPIADQAWLLRMSLGTWRQPLDGGVSARQLAHVVFVLAGFPDPTLHNTAMRCVTALLAIGGVSAALVAAGASFRLWALGLAIFVASSAPWIWTSADVLAAAGVAFVAVAAWRPLGPRATTAAAWVAAFAKPDMLVPTATLVAGAAWPQGGRRRIIASCAAVAAATIAVALVSPQPPSHRATLSFAQHYAAVTYWPQGDADAFTNGLVYRDRDFGPEMSVFEIIRTHPEAYSTFLGRSVVQSWRVLLQHHDWPALVLIAWAGWRLRREPFARGAVAFAVLMLATTTAFAFLHHRYMARLFALAVLLTARALSAAPFARVERAAMIASLGAWLGWLLTTWPTTFATGVTVIE